MAHPPTRTAEPADTGANGPIASIARFGQTLELAWVPPPVVLKLKQLLLDGISWMAMGTRIESASSLISTTCAGAAGEGTVTVVGTDRSTGLREGIFLNGCLAQVHDCNDVRRLARRDGGSNHPGRGVVPAALAMAEHFRLSGDDLLALLLIGYEVASRVVVPTPNHQYGATVGAMYGRAIRLPDEEYRRAITLAHLTLPATAGWAGSSDYDFLGNGLVLQAAISGALISSASLSLPANPGLRLARPHRGEDRSAASAFAATNVSIKPYPCCRSLHGAIDLAIDIRSREPLRPDEIDAIEVRVGNTQRELFEPAARDAPYKRCQFSIPFATACAFLDGRVDEHTFTAGRIAADDVADLQSRISVVHDEDLVYNPAGPAMYMRPTEIIVTTRGGDRITRETRSPRGSRLNPLSPAELRAKFLDWTGPTYPAARKAEIIRMVEELENLADASTLGRLLAASDSN